MEYIVAGYNMITDIYYHDGRVEKASPGGSFYSAAGIKMWRDSIAYVGTAGPDFRDYYGKFFDDNEIKTHVSEVLPQTLCYDLIYAEDGSWTEKCTYGEDYENMAKDIGRITPQMFAPLCDENTKGIYIEASLSAKIANDFLKIKELMPNGRLMWEINTEDLFDPSKKSAIMERIGQVDVYSVNLHEAKAFFSRETKEEIIKEIQNIGKPCFLRLGEEGAGFVTKDTVVFAPPVNVESSVDPTGCGNCSTAAALIGFSENLPMFDTVMMANISAGYNARQIGPWPKVDEKTRQEAFEMLEAAKVEAAKDK